MYVWFKLTDIQAGGGKKKIYINHYNGFFLPDLHITSEQIMLSFSNFSKWKKNQTNYICFQFPENKTTSSNRRGEHEHAISKKKKKNTSLYDLSNKDNSNIPPKLIRRTSCTWLCRFFCVAAFFLWLTAKATGICRNMFPPTIRIGRKREREKLT